MKSYFWLGSDADYDGEVVMACELARLYAPPVIDHTDMQAEYE